MPRSATAFADSPRLRPKYLAAGRKVQTLAGAVLLVSLAPAGPRVLAEGQPAVEPTVAVVAEGPSALGARDLFRVGRGPEALESVRAEAGRAALDGDAVLFEPGPGAVEDRLRLGWRTPDGDELAATVRVAVRPGTVPVNGVWGPGGAVGQGWFEASTSTFVLCADDALEGCGRRRLPVGGPGWSPFVARFAAGAPSTLGVHDPASGRLFLARRGLMESVLGPVGAQAIAADTDGDGVDEIGFFDGPSGVVYWADGRTTETPVASPSALAVVGDWDGDGR
ncbi:MAG: VCBS repeat-containing protein, partial [Acidobacteriota bacterium]